MEMEGTKELTLTVKKLVFARRSSSLQLCGFGRGPRLQCASQGLPPGGRYTCMSGFFPLFDDMAFHRRTLYALDHFEVLSAIDISVDHNTGDPWVTQIRLAIMGVPGLLPPKYIHDDYIIMKRLYLVELNGVSLMVRRRVYGRRETNPLQGRVDLVVPTGENKFEVFEAIFHWLRWDKWTAIGKEIDFCS
ncbi:hypothetical protein ACP70R_007421 [Stipagrostis hirtigluma subsp. patula]